MERWVNKVAVVTGASAGIGAAIAEKLVEHGLKVVGLARRKEKLQQLANSLEGKPAKFYPYKADITKQEEIEKAFQWITDNVGPVHILVNNAGLIRQTGIVNGNIEDWKTILNTDVLGLAIATREAIKIMQENNIDGHIVNINSVLGHQVPTMPYLSMLPAAKFALTAFTETVRKELIALGSKIKISSVSPSFVKTDVFIDNGFSESNEFLKSLQGAPILQPEDVANAVVAVLGTPPHVQITELTVRAVGDLLS